MKMELVKTPLQVLIKLYNLSTNDIKTFRKEKSHLKIDVEHSTSEQ